MTLSLYSCYHISEVIKHHYLGTHVITFQRLSHVIIVYRVLMLSHFRGYHMTLSLYSCYNISEVITCHYHCT